MSSSAVIYIRSMFPQENNHLDVTALSLTQIMKRFDLFSLWSLFPGCKSRNVFSLRLSDQAPPAHRTHYANSCTDFCCCIRKGRFGAEASGSCLPVSSTRTGYERLNDGTNSFSKFIHPADSAEYLGFLKLQVSSKLLFSPQPFHLKEREISKLKSWINVFSWGNMFEMSASSLTLIHCFVSYCSKKKKKITNPSFYLPNGWVSLKHSVKRPAETSCK